MQVLTDSSNPADNKEFLDEIRIMASVNNPFCIRILALCMTQQPQLITQLMPHGIAASLALRFVN